MKSIQNSPKTTIAFLISAITVYALGKGWIGQAEAELITQLSVVLGVFINKNKIASYFKQK